MQIFPQLSIVVCTYNRADLLAEVLETLFKQTIAPATYEVIVVDNNSTDQTREVVEGFSKNYLNVRYCLEERQGLSHARNRGWREARAQYVAYIDDDARLPEQWIAVSMDIIGRLAPGVFGGPYYAFYKSKKPKWWKDSYRSKEHAETARPLQSREYLSGGNIVFRRDLLEAAGGFDPNLGVSGNKIKVGEETRLIDVIREVQPRELVYYDPRLFIYHLVHPDKMRLQWLLKHWFLSGRSGYHVFPVVNLQSAQTYLRRLILSGLCIIVSVIWSITKRDKNVYPKFQNYLVEVIAKDIYKLGTTYEAFIVASRNKINLGIGR